MSEITGIDRDRYAALDVESFSHMLDDPSECYKFYWLEAIIQLLGRGENVIAFNDIFDIMIANAWYTVTAYHLRLGPRRSDGHVSNAIEKAVLSLNEAAGLPHNATRPEVLQALCDHRGAVAAHERVLAINVPYRLLSSFVSIKGGSKDWYHPEIMMDHFRRADMVSPLPYLIEVSEAGVRRIRIHPLWMDFMKRESAILLGWIGYQKVLFLQNRNPGVPGIIYKLAPEDERQRKLANVRKLWNALTEREPFTDIYNGKVLAKGNFDIDHFIPWSYIANDELWDLIPMDSALNSSKSNRLPAWDRYAGRFIGRQYRMYVQVHGSDEIRGLFDKCRRDNLNTAWGLDELYLPKHTEEEFRRILSSNLKPIYDSARLQGYRVWL